MLPKRTMLFAVRSVVVGQLVDDTAIRERRVRRYQSLDIVEISWCGWFVKTSDPAIEACDELPSDSVIGVVPEPASVTVPDVISSAGFVEPEIVKHQEKPADVTAQIGSAPDQEETFN